MIFKNNFINIACESEDESSLHTSFRCLSVPLAGDLIIQSYADKQRTILKQLFV